jgi:hypothetical protein
MCSPSKAPVSAKQAELDSRATEIESVKLLIAKLKQSSSCGLEDLEANRAGRGAAARSASYCARETDGSVETSASSLARGTAARCRDHHAVQKLSINMSSMPAAKKLHPPDGGPSRGNAAAE